MENLVWDKEKMEAKCTIDLPSGTLTTIAKCHPDDKFDLEYGKKLARKRLVTKYNRMRYLFFRELDKYMASCRSITSAKRNKYFLASEGDYHV